MRLPLDVVLAGGVTDCRNRNLQKMFQMIGEGEQVGSGLPRILSAWREQHWRTPLLREELEPDRTELVLTMESLLPEPTRDELERRWGDRFRQLTEHQRLALAAAVSEGRMNNRRLRELSGLHARDATLLFEELVRQGLLVPRGVTRGKYYVMADSDEIGGNPTPTVGVVVNSSWGSQFRRRGT